MSMKIEEIYLELESGAAIRITGLSHIIINGGYIDDEKKAVALIDINTQEERFEKPDATKIVSVDAEKVLLELTKIILEKSSIKKE